MFRKKGTALGTVSGILHAAYKLLSIYKIWNVLKCMELAMEILK